MTPEWISEAQKHIGTKEIPGPKHNSKILNWWKAIKRGGIKSDEIPWCAAFVGGCLEAVGIISSRFESAASYKTWGMGLKTPIYGCVAVFTRNGGGHVGFVVGLDTRGRLMILGGNQGDKVSIAPFDRSRVVAYRWPQAVPIISYSLPMISTAQASSTNEA